MTVRVMLYDMVTTEMTQADCRRLLTLVNRLHYQGYPVKTNLEESYFRVRYWIDFDTDEEAVLFKLSEL